MMILRGYRVNSQQHLEPVAVEVDGLPELMKQGPAWLDVVAAQPEELREVLAHFDLHPLVVEGCLEPQRRMRVEVLGNAMFLEYPVRVTKDATTPYVRFVCLSGLLITIPDEAAGELESVLHRGSAIRLPAQSVPAILYYLLDLDQDANLQVSLTLRDEVDALRDRMDDHTGSLDIQPLKRRANASANRYEDRLYCLSILLQIQTDAFQLAGLDEYFREVANRLRYLQQRMERLVSELQDLHNQYVATVQDKTNRKLNVLTIVQAVFVPLTLIAGIYGMNFDSMPELHWPHAYFICLGAMAGVALGELWLFYRRGWFD
jgi:magnesium transporter